MKNLLGGLLILFLIFIFIKSQLEKSSIKDKHKIACATIESVVSSRLKNLIDYSFYVDGKKYSCHYTCSDEFKEKFDLGLRKTFVAFDPDNPKVNLILENGKVSNDLNIQESDTSNLNCY